MGVAMNLKATSGTGGNYVKPPAGNHPAVCVAIIDLGTHKREFGGVSKEQRQIFFCWELPTETVAGTTGNHHVIGTRLTASLNEKAKLRQWIEARRASSIPDGADFNVFEEIGKPCLLNVKENGEYINVDGMAALPKGFAVPATQYKPFVWSLDGYIGGNLSFPDWLPYLFGEPVADVVASSAEVKAFPADKRPAPAGRSTSSPPASPPPPPVSNGTAPARSGPPPRQGPPPKAATPADPKYWIDLNLGGEPELDTMASLQAMMASELGTKIDLNNVKVCPDGGSEWTPILQAHPAAKTWTPW